MTYLDSEKGIRCYLLLHTAYIKSQPLKSVEWFLLTFESPGRLEILSNP